MKRQLSAISIATCLAASSGAALAVDPPYQADMERLAHIMGALYHLDNICLKSGQDWRADFGELMDLDEVDDDRRARLTTEFNMGYQDYFRLHVKCTDNAKMLLQRFANEGEDISRNIHTRFAE